MNRKCKHCAALTRYGIKNYCGYLEIVLEDISQNESVSPCEQQLSNNVYP